MATCGVSRNQGSVIGGGVGTVIGVYKGFLVYGNHHMGVEDVALRVQGGWWIDNESREVAYFLNRL